MKIGHKPGRKMAAGDSGATDRKNRNSEFRFPPPKKTDRKYKKMVMLCDLRLRSLDLRIALARRAEGFGLIVALDGAPAAVDLGRWVA